MLRLNDLVPSRPFMLLAALYVLGLVQFALLRCVFLWSHSSLIGQASTSDLLTTFMVGVRFDQIIVLYVLLLPLLILPWLDLGRRGVRQVAGAYFTLCYTTTALLLLVDIRFFQYFQSHLNYLAYEYLGHPALVWDLIGSDRWLIPIALAVVAMAAGLYATIRWLCIRLLPPAHRRSWTAQIGWTAVLIGFSVVGLRGGMGLAPIDWGAATFSSNQFLNQAALNGIYTLARNMSEQDGDRRLSNLEESERFAFVPTDTALATVREMLATPGSRFVDPAAGITRLTVDQHVSPVSSPNVIVIVMESWAACNTGVLGSPHDLTPNFDSASRHGYLFTNFYANGIRTSFGLPAVLCSFPALPGRSIMGRYDARHPFTSLSELMHEQGYCNAFVYGGDLVFDNMKGFFQPKKYDRFYGEEELGSEHAFSKWGLPDHTMFEKAAAIIDSLPRPFQLSIMTLSNHEPWDLPDSSVRAFFDDADSSRVFNSQRYADYALGLFMRALARRHMTDSTWLVLTADHARIRPGRFPLDPETMRIPLLVVPPGGLPQGDRRIDVVGSQVDIIPTLIGLMGGRYQHSSWGRDLLNLPEDDRGFAVLSSVDRVGYLDGEFFYAEWLGRSQSLYDARNLSSVVMSGAGRTGLNARQRRLHHYLQAAEQMRLADLEREW
ncbi:MAG: LTA synthase family protein [bacterium]